MKTRDFGILTIVLVTGGAPPLRATLNRCTSTNVPPTPQQCTVDVHVRADGNGKCYVASMQPFEKIRVRKGSTVTWNFQNDCGTDLDLGIGNFRWNGEVAKPKDERDPFEGTSRNVKVLQGARKDFPAKVRSDVKETVSYKYDILAGTTVLLDPEAEIRP